MIYKRVLFLLLLAGCGISNSAFAQAYCFQGTHPSNVVAVSLVADQRCASKYAYNVSSPSEYLQICDISRSRARSMGWVTVAQSSHSGLSGCSIQGTGFKHTIRRPKNGMWICDSTAPSGFRIQSSVYDTKCSVNSLNQSFSYYIVSNWYIADMTASL